MRCALPLTLALLLTAACSNGLSSDIRAAPAEIRNEIPDSATGAPSQTTEPTLTPQAPIATQSATPAPDEPATTQAETVVEQTTGQPANQTQPDALEHCQDAKTIRAEWIASPVPEVAREGSQFPDNLLICDDLPQVDDQLECMPFRTERMFGILYNVFPDMAAPLLDAEVVFCVDLR